MKSLTPVQLYQFVSEVGEATKDAPASIRYGLRLAALSDKINAHFAQPDGFISVPEVIAAASGKTVIGGAKVGAAQKQPFNRKGGPGHPQSMETRLKISRGLHHYNSSRPGHKKNTPDNACAFEHGNDRRS